MDKFNEIKDGIYDWINGRTGVTVIWQNENQPIPDVPYFATRLDSIVQIGHPYITPPDDDGSSSVKFSYDFTLHILGFGYGIVEKTHMARQALGRPSVVSALDNKGIAIVEPLPVMDISEVLNDVNMEERSSCDIMMRMSGIEEDEQVGVIEKVTAEGTYQQPGKPDRIESLTVN